MFKSIKQKLFGQNASHPVSRTYVYEMARALWMNRNYEKFASESYIKNVIAHRAISTIATAAASVPFKLYQKNGKALKPVENHPILNLLKKPNPVQSGKEFLESVYTYRQISGNAFVLGVTGVNQNLLELYSLRPDRVSIIPSEKMIPKSYCYQVDNETVEYPVNPISGKSQILHIKNFHPLSDWYGLSSIEAAAYSIDQHNQAGEWNQALLQNGARPSGAIIVNGKGGGAERLTDSQFNDLKKMVDEIFSGPKNAGRPLLLEGGLDWKEMSITPKDMDFIESKHSSARDIALALGMPPQMLGIPGDNTYANLQEARIAFWEQTVLPLVENVVENFSNWFAGFHGSNIELSYDIDDISALSARREAVWSRVENSTFLTINEKRAAVGLGPILSGGQFK